ncbi:winged helix-turn-helix transcriptional regulator [Phycicoccus sp. BSK3Z-2]|uniref:Winged helix-turn-helix transcriptional regulator n=1 Tax=Phycicoccus avicenniae TaxID=2828860 RepID=A0A941D9N8_9MICO|nr:MarR family winged helix-turn-helix transcriptional regulator [Phycicoccus avicenniae]MBR7744674.1 winged helix-turn-helix transcriptional regulator [Phycicoccus avicenniae]
MTTEDLANDLLRLSARVSQWASRHADPGMPWAQVRVLSHVERLGPARVTTLAAADDTTQPTTTAQVQRLEADGLVERTPDPDDGRAHRVALTAAGREALARARRERAAAVLPLLDGLDGGPERVADAVDLLEELVAAIEADRPTPVPGA